MSLFDTIGSLLGRATGPRPAFPRRWWRHSAIRKAALAGCIQKFEAAGLGTTISSWVGNGENQAVGSDALHGVLGSDLVQQIAAKTGLPVDQLLPQIAQHLPQLVDSLTPNGQVPSGGSALLEAGLAFLKSRSS